MNRQITDSHIWSLERLLECKWIRYSSLSRYAEIISLLTELGMKNQEEYRTKIELREIRLTASGLKILKELIKEIEKNLDDDNPIHTNPYVNKMLKYFNTLKALDGK